MESAPHSPKRSSALSHEQLCAMLRGSQFFGDFMCLLIEGAAGLFKQDRSYGSKLIAQIDEGKTAGEMAVVDGEQRSAICVCTRRLA